MGTIDNDRRVVVTGLGAVTPIGNTVPAFWQNLTNGVSGVARITQFDPSDLNVQIRFDVGAGASPRKATEQSVGMRIAAAAAAASSARPVSLVSLVSTRIAVMPESIHERSRAGSMSALSSTA